MSSQTNLEIEGNLSEHPLAELLVETTGANLSGSFRLALEEKKVIIYLDEGEVVFAASNQRQHRLFEILLREQIISRQQLVGIKNFVNDFELGENLIDQGILTKPDLDVLFSRQIEEIIRTSIKWKTGTWHFSSLVRIKEGVGYPVDLAKILLDYLRSLTAQQILSRFGSDGESFGLRPDAPVPADLQSHEAFILSRFDNSSLRLDQIGALSGLPEELTRQSLYILWLRGFLSRQNWNSALSENRIAEILSAKLQIKKDEEAEVRKRQEAFIQSQAGQFSVDPENEAPPELDEEQLLDQYLERVENAVTLYEIVGVSPEAQTSEIKQNYFAQAKKYHPDLFYKQEEVHGRVQDAFSKLAHAYETLKTEKSRDLYDFKMRKELADVKARQESGITDEQANLNKQFEQAAKNFELGVQLMDEGEFETSAPFFARAVHFDGENPRYHAFYGKALSYNRKQQHKAESEIQSAIRLDPDNMTYRVMLAELFANIGLLKRAEGELNRLLAIAPDNREALALLDSLQKK
ncbi:MAG: DnaJ domain-containing protein [Pyrinomonadaceae bacterium]